MSKPTSAGEMVSYAGRGLGLGAGCGGISSTLQQHMFSSEGSNERRLQLKLCMSMMTASIP